MKPAPFAYSAPRTVAAALSTLGHLGEEGRVLAGGQSLVPLMNFRLAQPAHLVDITRLAELDYVRVDGDRLAVGAVARQVTLERSAEAAGAAPLLVEAVKQVGHPPIRHRGTVCGSIAHAEPAAELPAAALALGATVVLSGRGGDRELPLEDFLTGPYSTSIQPGEMLRELRLPRWTGRTGHAFVEYSRRHGDFAIAGVAVALGLDGDRVGRAAVALCGVGPTTIRSGRAEQFLQGRSGSAEEIVEAAGLAVEGLKPVADVHGSPEYRVRVARACARRALQVAFARARGEQGGSE